MKEDKGEENGKKSATRDAYRLSQALLGIDPSHGDWKRELELFFHEHVVLASLIVLAALWIVWSFRCFRLFGSFLPTLVTIVLGICWTYMIFLEYVLGNPVAPDSGEGEYPSDPKDE